MKKNNHRQKNKGNKQGGYRADGYQNVFMNIGNSRDRSAYTRITASYLLGRRALENLYLGDDIARRIVDCVADEMFRAGFDVDGVKDQPGIMSRWDELNVTQHLTDAVAWSRLYGGSLVVFGINDGGDLESELGTGELEFIRVYDRFQVRVAERDENPQSKAFGEVVLYEIQPLTGSSYKVHASRCHVFDGERIPNNQRKQNDGWGASVLQGCHGAIVDYSLSHKHASSLLERKQQGVWSARGLADLCCDDEGEEVVRRRLSLVDMTRGNSNTIGVDAETETYTLLNGDLSDVVDVLDRKQTRLSAMTGIDEQILFTKTPSGQGADKTTVPESWKQLVGRKQRDVGRPAVEKIISLLTDDPTWTIKFRPLSVPSDKENADTAKAWADADDKYLATGSVSQSELRDTLRKRGWYTLSEAENAGE